MNSLIVEELEVTVSPAGASDSVAGVPCIVWLAFVMLR